MRPAGKARRVRISGIFERGATQPDGMHRRSNAAGLAPRAATAARALGGSTASGPACSGEAERGCMLCEGLDEPPITRRADQTAIAATHARSRPMCNSGKTSGVTLPKRQAALRPAANRSRTRPAKSAPPARAALCHRPSATPTSAAITQAASAIDISSGCAIIEAGETKSPVKRRGCLATTSRRPYPNPYCWRR